MSDEAPAEVIAEPIEAPAEGAEKPAPKEAKPEVDELEEYLKKKPLTYKAAGKEQNVKDAKQLRQMLSRVSGVDAAASEALKAKQEAAELKSRRDRVKSLKGADRARAIAEFFEEDPEAMREAFADDILADDAKRQERAKLSERERQMADELDKYKSEHARMREAHEAQEREQKEQQMMERVQEIGARLEKTAVGVLQKLSIPPTAAPHFLPAIARALDRAERLRDEFGIEVDEDEVAGKVMEEQGQMADTFYSSLPIPALADRLEAQMVEDPSKPGEKVSRAMLLKREYARRIKERTGAPAIVTNGAPRPQPKLESDADKMAFWRR
jgi:hypothetical protein